VEHGPEMLAISSHSAGLTEVIELTGEFDSHGMVRFRAAIDELLMHHPTGIGIDAAEVTFIDSGGLRALLMAQQIANAAGVGLRVVKTSPSVDRILDMTSLHEVLCAPV
jgi:anti-anti-sigma factor